MTTLYLGTGRANDARNTVSTIGVAWNALPFPQVKRATSALPVDQVHLYKRKMPG